MSNKIPISPLRLWNDFRNWGLENKHYNKRCSYCYYHLGNSKGLGSCESGTLEEEQICTSYAKSQYHRHPTTNANEVKRGRAWMWIKKVGQALRRPWHWTANRTGGQCWAWVRESWQVCLVWATQCFQLLKILIENIFKWGNCIQGSWFLDTLEKSGNPCIPSPE